jgi:predicted nucleic acid-binding protein
LIVVDSSLALSWCFSDEQTAEAIAVLERVAAEGMVVPMLWHLEVANVLQLAVRRERISVELRDASLADLRELRIETDGLTVDQAWSSTIAIAHLHRLTVYDASYLELTMRRGLPLATLDKELIAAARAEGVEVLPSAA